MQPEPPQQKHAQKEWMIIQRDDSNIALGVVGGILGALFGAALWGAVVAYTHYEIGILSIVVGACAGYGVRLLGKGTGISFALLGALCAILGSLAGSILAVAILVAQHNDQSVFVVLSRLNPDIAWRFLEASFGWLDLLFYAVAAYVGFRVGPAPQRALLS